MRKQTVCIGENKVADQLFSNCTADQCLCFRCTDSTILLLLKSRNFKLIWPASVTIQVALCQTWSDTPIIGFLTHRLIYDSIDSLFAYARFLILLWFFLIHKPYMKSKSEKNNTLLAKILNMYLTLHVKRTYCDGIASLGYVGATY